MAKPELLIPVAFVNRWLMETDSVEDFSARLAHYSATHATNWEVPDAGEDQA